MHEWPGFKPLDSESNTKNLAGMTSKFQIQEGHSRNSDIKQIR
jgi:hypothetical protein